MVFNNNKFGILTNWQRALFLRRAETSDRSTLEYYTVELEGPDQPFSMLKAWVGMVLLAEDDRFYAPSSILGRNFGTSRRLSGRNGTKLLSTLKSIYYLLMAITGVSLLTFTSVTLTSAQPAVERMAVW